MENAYLKNTVGPVLARAVAETVVAQPSNPQEYLALYLLHHLQEEARKENEASRRRRGEQLREEWTQTRALQEKFAVDTIQRGFKKFRARLQAKKSAEEAMQAQYEEAVEEADELLEQFESERDAQRQQNNNNSNNGSGGGRGADEEDVDGLGGALGPKLSTEELEDMFIESRSEFFRAQRFLLGVQKSQLGELKTSLLEQKERVRMAADAVLALRDDAVASEEAQRDVECDPAHQAPHLSDAAKALLDQVQSQRDHTRVSVPHVLFRVLRCLCYLLYDATPKQTDTPEKVAALLKPTVAVPLLRALDPVANYDKQRPLKLERLVSGHSGDGGEEEAPEAVEGEEESDPRQQPRTRQIKRVLRVLRVLMLDNEYISEANPADYYDEEEVEENETLAKEVAEGEAAAGRATMIREAVENQVKARGGTLLWALLQYVRKAVEYRTCRDTYVEACRAQGIDPSEPQDVPEEDEDDEDNFIDEDGEIDAAAVDQLHARQGIDVDESLAKLWETRDTRNKTLLVEKSVAFRKAAALEADEEEEVEEDA